MRVVCPSVYARLLSSSLTIVLAALFTACGDKPQQLGAQVAASVDGHEISFPELEFTLSQRPDLQALGAAGRPLVLQELIGRTLSENAALDLKLDREPGVLLALQSARRDVLTKAYIERVAGSGSRPSAKDVSDYYAAKPALFKDRHVFSLVEFDFDATPARQAEIGKKLDTASSLAAVRMGLQEEKVRFDERVTIRLPESLPLAVLDKVSTLAPGRPMFVPRAGGVTVLVITGSLAAPIPFDQARPVIEQYLANVKRREAADAQLQLLREKAKVLYSDSVSPKAPDVNAPAASVSAK